MIKKLILFFYYNYFILKSERALLEERIFEMKQSLYNYCFKNGDNIIMFNARTNALAKLSLNEYEQLKKCDLGTKSTITKE